MPIPDASRDDVVAAMDLFDAELRDSDAWLDWEANGNYRFAVVRDGQRYPVKQIVAEASGVGTREFSGGEEANGWLRRRGFEVVDLRPGSHEGNRLPSWWWVNQGATYEQERAGGYLWAPKQGKAGYAFGHWTNMAKLQVRRPGGPLRQQRHSGDRRGPRAGRRRATPGRIAHRGLGRWRAISRGWTISPLTSLIALREIPAEWRYAGSGPFTQDGGVKQGYLFPLATDFMEHLVAQFPDRLPQVARDWRASQGSGEPAAVAAVRAAVEAMYPDAAVRTTCLTVLAEAIEQAHAISPVSWSVSMPQGRNDIRFNVLWTQPCTLRKDDLYLVVDRNTMPEDAGDRLEAVFAGDPRNGPVYPSMQYASAYGAHLPLGQLEELLPLVREPNHRFIALCAGRVKRRAHRFGEHVPAVVDYLRQELGRDLPQPGILRTRDNGPIRLALSGQPPRVEPCRGSPAPGRRRRRHLGGQPLSGADATRRRGCPVAGRVRRPGIYALGELVDVPFARPTSNFFPDHEQRPPEEWAVPFVYTAIVAPPLLRPELQAHPVLKELSVIRAPQGTNFKVTVEQWKALQELLADRSLPRSPRWWVEKTEVRGWDYRIEGEFAVGRALVAPAKSASGADLYRQVRELVPGDVVLHFTDQRAFTGWSRVAGPAEEIDTRPEFGIGPRAHARRAPGGLPLASIRPWIGRRSSPRPTRSACAASSNEGHTNTFYSVEPELRLKGGAYLTPASPELVAILKDAYQDRTGLDLGPTDMSVPDVSALRGAGLRRHPGCRARSGNAHRPPHPAPLPPGPAHPRLRGALRLERHGQDLAGRGLRARRRGPPRGGGRGPELDHQRGPARLPEPADRAVPPHGFQSLCARGRGSIPRGSACRRCSTAVPPGAGRNEPGPGGVLLRPVPLGHGGAGPPRCGHDRPGDR